ncbi:MAG: TerB family tellurite resistance protein [Alphaproteobacteria bacterium]
MIGRIKHLFGALGVGAPEASEAAGIGELQLAAAALLASAALGDDRFDEAERAAIDRLLRERFGLDAAEAKALIEAAEERARDATHLLRFTRVIKDNFSPEERIGLIEMIWEVVYADGALHAYEDSLLRRIAGLIYVTDRDRGEARKRVLRRLGATAQ